MANVKILDNIISSVDSDTKKAEHFLSVQNKVATNFKENTKLLYDFTKEQFKRKTDALPELVTEDFDEEQIWQQLELQNEGEWPYFLTNVSRVLAGNSQLTLPISLTKPDPLLDDESTRNNIESEDENKISETNVIAEDTKKTRKVKSLKNTRKRNQKNSIVDDKFFKLQELDEYLTKEDKREKKSNDKDNDESDGESLDLFNDLSEKEDENDTENARLIKYAAFFDSPESEDDDMANNSRESVDINFEGDSKNEDDDLDSEMNSDIEDQSEPIEIETNSNSKKRVKFNLTNDSDDTDSIENKQENPNEKDPEIKSSLEARQERLQKRIQELEEEVLSEKPWQLRGEVDATKRPQNSLLEEYVEFDITSRPAPIITEQTTLNLEDIIRQRIKDKAWDDVEKKFKPVETPKEYKKKLVMDQEKSQQSLAQIYENEYLKQKESLNPDATEKEVEEPKEHIEIRESMNALFAKLDALSNFHYTPKMAKPDIKIISNLPAVSVEEVAPIATSDAALLAPEEVQAKPRGDLIGKAERTNTDMKRERRQKKLRQRERQKAKEKREKMGDTLKPSRGKKFSKEKAAEAIAKLSKERNVLKVDETSHKVTKSSTAFFNQLQDQVKSQIKSKTGAASKRKDKSVVSAVKLKL
ncbi:U3 small nucleolar ribonucleoprotein protein MPP10 [Cephus cinctus]|uniref:U3 small nucleolar ribonucleoprotein protein MPP10 n=1 Tax=Cephus cinctus TaxID=211228 RepID=A0AAJ7CE66_CEPCN|nr:U3 small nucleolar ribonucleoprotein protein MPP10 [Cephus cinctus]